MLPNNKPELTQVEVTLLGPGYGESVLLHYGGSWIVIDSCRHTSKVPAAVFYLDSIGVPLDTVSQVACTHWHDDHCAGLSDLYEKTVNAELVISGALKTNDFVNLAHLYSTNKGDDVPSGVDEMYKTLSTARLRGKTPRFVRSDQLIWRSNDGNAELYALSPCDTMIAESLITVSAMLPTAYSIRRPIVAKDNHVSVAMLFKVGSHAILLGSDLEEHGSKTKGWSTIVSGNCRPQIKSSLYKVAHHGSETGEYSGIWDDLLIEKPISLLTPFSKLSDPLPRAPDRDRIKSRSSVAVLTADAKAARVNRSSALKKILKKNNLRVLHPSFGAVRCRIDSTVPGSSWSIEKSTDAINL